MDCMPRSTISSSRSFPSLHHKSPLPLATISSCRAFPSVHQELPLPLAAAASPKESPCAAQRSPSFVGTILALKPISHAPENSAFLSACSARRAAQRPHPSFRKPQLHDPPEATCSARKVSGLTPGNLLLSGNTSLPSSLPCPCAHPFSAGPSLLATLPRSLAPPRAWGRAPVVPTSFTRQGSSQMAAIEAASHLWPNSGPLVNFQRLPWAALSQIPPPGTPLCRGSSAWGSGVRCSSSSSSPSSSSSAEDGDGAALPEGANSSRELQPGEGVRNEVEGGRSSEWMGDEREVEIASRLIARWKKEEADSKAGPPHPPPQDMLLQAVADLSRREGRTAKTTNVVMGGTAATPYGDDWLELDKKVNKYPSWRGFTAIGTGGDDFVDSMVVAVESVLEERIPRWQVTARESAQGRYVSVKIGPVRMESSDQVRAVYEAMRKDERMRYFL